MTRGRPGRWAPAAALALLIGCALCLGCTAPAPAAAAPEKPARPEQLEQREQLEHALAAALADWDAAPTEEHAIWVGRRLAYLGQYEAALRWYTDALATWPESYRLWRHRGHREITLRDFQSAIESLERARRLADGHADEIEPDGAPNALGIPLTTTHGNIDYHLALAHYLAGDLERAAAAWRRSLDLWAQNDDARVAAAHWLYTTLVRLERHAEALFVIEALPTDPDVIENFAYRDLVDLYAGRTTVDALLTDGSDPNQNAARTYGIARWLLANDDPQAGQALLTRLAESAPRASFGRIAAEADCR